VKDLYTTTGYALGLSLPVTVLCWFYMLRLIPTAAAQDGILGVFLAPELWLVHVLHQNGQGHISGFAFVPLALLAQFVGYFIVIFILRALLRLTGGGRSK
jgi:hypothetical protein